MAAILEGNTLTLTGDVGDYWFGDHFTHADVVVALAQVEEDSDLTVYLNSGGGLTDEGSAIHALLSRRPGTTDIVVDGVAASAASLIAMAGDTVTMSAGSIMMIHDPSVFTFGTSADHAKSVEMLEAIGTAYARVYASKSGKTTDECRAIMKAEKWLAPEEAVAEGFADRTSDDAAKPVAAFDYRIYAHAPQRLKTLASKKNWRRPDDAGKRTSASVSTRQKQEIPMTDKTTAEDKTAADLDKAKAEASRDAVAADRERRKSIMALEEAKGRETLAAYYADETDDSVDRVTKALAAAPKAQATDERDPAADYERRRLNGEGLNGNTPAPTATAKVKAGWDRAVETANRRFQ